MKSSVAFVLLLGVAATLLNPAISAAQEFQVLINGTVTLVSVAGTPVSSGPSLQVSAQARGPSGSLTGHGLDTTFHGNPGGPPPGTCTFRLLTGSVAGTVVTLSGSVSSSTNPVNVGAGATFLGDGSTGAITFTFDTGGAVGGPFLLTGVGEVLIQ